MAVTQLAAFDVGVVVESVGVQLVEHLQQHLSECRPASADFYEVKRI
jgi:hypothetical protein